MADKVYFYGDDRLTTKFKKQKFEDILKAISDKDWLGVDTETTVTESILSRKLKVISVSWKAGKNCDMAVFEWDYLSFIQQQGLLFFLSRNKCIMHNVSFDYQMFKKYGKTFEKLYCTYLGEQILETGLPAETGRHGLKATYQRRFEIDMSKASQLTFGEGPYTDEQIRYAALDVYKLIELREAQAAEMRSDDKITKMKFHKGLIKTAWWENEFVKVVGDMETNGVCIDRKQWYAIADEIQPVQDRELKVLNDIAKRDFRGLLEENDWISDKDRFGKIWDSSTKKSIFLRHVYGDTIDKTSSPALVEWLKEHDKEYPEGLAKSGKAFLESDYMANLSNEFVFIKLLILRKGVNKQNVTDTLNQLVKDNYLSFLKEHNWIILANTVTLNWDSPVQKLVIFNEITPLEKTGKDYIKDVQDKHVLFPHYLSYAEVTHQLKAFGKHFYDENVDLDGRFRPRFKQILATGRLSSVRPNLLAVPNKAVYRKAFIAQGDNVLVGADYSAEEIVIMATLAKEPRWLEAIKKGWDIHSVNAEITYGKKWHDATEDGCDYVANHQKCNCTGHKKLRTDVKTVVFSSAYGGTFIKIAFLLKISKEEAIQLLKDFYSRVPNIKKMMDKFGKYSIEKGRIIEPVFGRSRFYPKWKLILSSEYESIKRTALNYPIQSSGGAILKIASVLLRRWINHAGLEDNVKIILLVHDEFLLECTPKHVPLAKEKLTECMVLGAQLAGFAIEAGADEGHSWNEIH